MQEAKKANIVNIRHMSDAADQDAAEADCDRINRTGHSPLPCFHFVEESPDAY